jgi:antitoxin component YwqK of YwqJK toxin-antitoxin module
MKYFLSSIFSAFILITAYTQEYKNVYYNSNWEITSKKYAIFFRNSGFNNTKMVFDSIVSDFYISGKPEMTGFYNDGLKNGEFKYFNPNGSIFLSTEYKNNMRSGTWIEYFKNGEIKKEIKYQNNKEYLTQYNDSNGMSILKNNSCKYILEYATSEYYSSNAISLSSNTIFEGSKKIDAYKLSGAIHNGLKDGPWVLKKNSQLYCKMNYKDGILINGFMLLEGSKVPLINDVLAPLFNEPEKLGTTEGLLLEPGQMIKNNYIMEALSKEHQKKLKKKILDNKEDFIKFFCNNFSVQYEDCKDTNTIKIKVITRNDGEISSFSITPSVPNKIQTEVNKILNCVSRIQQLSENEISFNYRILCVDELQYKK